MHRRRGSVHRWLTVLLVIVALAFILIGAYGTYLADQAGYLPWQEEPTRIAVTPFADLTMPTPESTPTR